MLLLPIHIVPLEDKILEAAVYIQTGDPLKDVMEDIEVHQAILYLAQKIKNSRDLKRWEDGNYAHYHC